MSLSQVVAATTTGALYDTVPPNKSTLVDNNGGAAKKVTTTDLIDGVAVSTEDLGVFGSTVVITNDVSLADFTLEFRYDNNKPVGKRLPLSQSTNANDYLTSGSADPSNRRSIHKIQVLGMGYAEGVRTRLQTTAIREGYWNEYTGQFDPGYPVVIVDVFGTDSAANPTRSVPGRLSFAGQSATTTTNYSEKTG